MKFSLHLKNPSFQITIFHRNRTQI